MMIAVTWLLLLPRAKDANNGVVVLFVVVLLLLLLLLLLPQVLFCMGFLPRLTDHTTYSKLTITISRHVFITAAVDT